MSIREMIEQSYAAYADRDLDGTMAPFSENVVFNWPVSSETSKNSGVSHGKQAMMQRLGALAEDFEYEGVELDSLIVEGQTAAARVCMRLLHKETERKVVNYSAHFWRFDGGKCVELTEYFDTALIASCTS